MTVWIYVDTSKDVTGAAAGFTHRAETVTEVEQTPPPFQIWRSNGPEVRPVVCTLKTDLMGALGTDRCPDLTRGSTWGEKGCGANSVSVGDFGQ